MVNCFKYISKEEAERLLLSVGESRDYEIRTNSNKYTIGDYSIIEGAIPIMSELDSTLNYETVMEKLYKLYIDGINVSPVLGFLYDPNEIYKKNFTTFAYGLSIQMKPNGEKIWEEKKLPKDLDQMPTLEQQTYFFKRTYDLESAPQEHYDKWVKDYRSIVRTGLIVDSSKSENFFYDEKTGFSFTGFQSIGPDSFEDQDFFGKKNHREFISTSFFPCCSDLIINRNFASEKEIEQFEKANINIFKKCLSALLKIGISKEDIHEALFVNQRLSKVTWERKKIYGVREGTFNNIYKSILVDIDKS